MGNYARSLVMEYSPVASKRWGLFLPYNGRKKQAPTMKNKCMYLIFLERLKRGATQELSVYTGPNIS